jgi:hypothetical protein
MRRICADRIPPRRLVRGFVQQPVRELSISRRRPSCRQLQAPPRAGWIPKRESRQ